MATKQGGCGTARRDWVGRWGGRSKDTCHNSTKSLLLGWWVMGVVVWWWWVLSSGGGGGCCGLVVVVLFGDNVCGVVVW